MPKGSKYVRRDTGAGTRSLWKGTIRAMDKCEAEAYAPGRSPEAPVVSRCAEECPARPDAEVDMGSDVERNTVSEHERGAGTEAQPRARLRDPVGIIRTQ